MIADISSKTLKRFFAASPIPLTLSSPVFDDCPLVLVNDAFLEISGYEREEIIGRNCRFMQGPRTDPEARARLRFAIQSKNEALVPIINYRKDGSPFECYVFLMPVFGRGGSLLYYLGSQCDITSHKSQLSALEHAQVLEENIEISNLRLHADEQLSIRAEKPCRDRLANLMG